MEVSENTEQLGFKEFTLLPPVCVIGLVEHRTPEKRPDMGKETVQAKQRRWKGGAQPREELRAKQEKVHFDSRQYGNFRPVKT